MERLIGSRLMGRGLLTCRLKREGQIWSRLMRGAAADMQAEGGGAGLVQADERGAADVQAEGGRAELVQADEGGGLLTCRLKGGRLSWSWLMGKGLLMHMLRAGRSQGFPHLLEGRQKTLVSQ
jgi:hypothetical protein